MQGEAPAPDADLARQREVVDAFFAAAREGDFDALVAVLDPDVVLRSDGGAARPAATRVVRGAEAVAGGRSPSRGCSPFVRPGARQRRRRGRRGARAAARSRSWPSPSPDGRIVAIDVLADPERLASST